MGKGISTALQHYKPDTGGIYAHVHQYLNAGVHKRMPIDADVCPSVLVCMQVFHHLVLIGSYRIPGTIYTQTERIAIPASSLFHSWSH